MSKVMNLVSLTAPSTDLRRVLPESQFLRALSLERKRAERSQTRFVVMQLDVATLAQNATHENLLLRTVFSLVHSVRETDIVGWYKQRSALGVIFAELGKADTLSVLSALQTKMLGTLRSALRAEEVERINIAFCCYPEDDKAQETRQTIGVNGR